MKEYNWREEREKFRPEFRKNQPEMPRIPEGMPPQNTDGRRIIASIAFMIVLALIVLGGYFFLNSRSEKRAAKTAEAVKDSTEMLSEVAEKHKKAVGLVTVTVELNNGNKLVENVGTAWACGENKFATNAHVAKGLETTVRGIKKQIVLTLIENYARENNYKNADALCEKIGKDKFEKLFAEAVEVMEQKIKNTSASVIINGTHGKSYPITHYQVHREYGIINTKFNPDVAILTIQGEHGLFFKIASDDKLQELKAGEPIAFLGFPIENLIGENVNLSNPIASMQTGNIVAVSDFELRDAGKEGNHLIRHNLPSTGGASGSPIFNKEGEVVALLYAGNMIRQQNGDRAPSAAMINMAVRADLLEGMGELRDVAELLK